jgi:hypothetical protein
MLWLQFDNLKYWSSQFLNNVHDHRPPVTPGQVAITLPNIMWCRKETVIEVMKKLSFKGLLLEFVVKRKADILAAYDVINNLRIEKSIVFVGEFRSLSLTNSQVKDLTPLSVLLNLKDLYLCHMRVKDLSPLSGLG